MNEMKLGIAKNKGVDSIDFFLYPLAEDMYNYNLNDKSGHNTNNQPHPYYIYTRLSIFSRLQIINGF